MLRPPLVSLVEELDKGRAPAGDHVGAVDGVLYGEDADVALRTVDRHGVSGFARVRDQHHAAAGSKPREGSLSVTPVWVSFGETTST